MSQLDFSGFASRKALSEILSVPPRVESVYSLLQHVWAGSSDQERQQSKKQNKVRLETLDEFFIDPVRSYLNRVMEKIAENEGQGFWLQAEFGVGKSHLLAVAATLAVGGVAVWERVKRREDEEGKAGRGARLDSLWRKKVESRRIFPVVFSLEGKGGGTDKKLEDFILDEAQETFGLREGKPLAVYPEEHLARLFMREHHKIFKDELRTFLADKRLMRGLPVYQYEELIEALKRPEGQRDAGRLLFAFYRHKGLTPNVPTERGERLGRAVRDILDAGYGGVFIVIDEMSEYLRRAVAFNADDEDCLLTLSNKLAKVEGLPVWTLVAAQMAHTNPQKIIAPDRLREETLEHKPERFRDIVVQRTRTITDRAGVKAYFDGYRNLVPWVKAAAAEDFEAAFPFPPEALVIIRDISKQLTGTRSTISFLHRALQNATQQKSKDLVPLWRIFDDLMSYNETPSASSTGAVSIRNKFRGQVAALEAAQATLKRVSDGQLARPQNRSRAERILNTLFLYHLAGVAGLTKEQILDAVTDLKPGEDELEAQLGHYETILEEMRAKLRNQIRFNQGRYEFVPKETSQYDDLVQQAADKLKGDPELLGQMLQRVMAFTDSDAPSPFAGFVSMEEKRFSQVKVERWHGQERAGRVGAADLGACSVSDPDFEIDTHSNEEDFLVIIARKPMSEKAVEKWLAKGGLADPRLVVWAPADVSQEDRATLAGVLAHLLVATEQKDTKYEKEGLKEFKREAHRAYTVLRAIYGRGVARSARTSISVSLVGDAKGALEAMASEAMDTCYRSRLIDFGNRKFDAPGAVKLVNGLVKRGKAVSEGDQLWSAVENFGEPLGLVRPEAPKRLDPSGNEFYQAIRTKIEANGGVGLEVRTVYNWFTGYNRADGQESPGLTRRMVDVYLLCLAQQGVIRVSQSKGNGWIDRSSIGSIEFKPETLRGLSRIELPRALQDWEVFSPYAEVLSDRPPGELAPKYDKAKADEALRSIWDTWVQKPDIERMEHDVRELFAAIGQAEKSPFDDVLLFWLEFADELRPEIFIEEEVFNTLRRAVLRALGVEGPEGLSGKHLILFKDQFHRLRELRDSFTKTSVLLIRAARFASAPVPDERWARELRKAQEQVLAELRQAEQLVLNPDSVSTRLQPRFTELERLYLDAFLERLMQLDAAQRQLDEIAGEVKGSDQVKVLEDLADDVPEAKNSLAECLNSLDARPPRLRRGPEDRDKAEKELRPEGRVRDINGADMTLSRLVSELSARSQAVTPLQGTGASALLRVCSFLRTPAVSGHLAAFEPKTKGLREILAAQGEEELGEALQTMPRAERRELGRLLNAILGSRRMKSVALRSFVPQVGMAWEQKDIDAVVEEFRQFLENQWEDDTYLKFEVE